MRTPPRTVLVSDLSTPPPPYRSRSRQNPRGPYIQYGQRASPRRRKVFTNTDLFLLGITRIAIASVGYIALDMLDRYEKKKRRWQPRDWKKDRERIWSRYVQLGQATRRLETAYDSPDQFNNSFHRIQPRVHQMKSLELLPFLPHLMNVRKHCFTVFSKLH
jgi:hypothetical protein